MLRRTACTSECAAPAHVPSAPEVSAEYQHQMSASALGKMSGVVGSKKKKSMQKRLLLKEKNKIELNQIRVLAMTEMFEDALDVAKDDLNLASDTPLGLQHISHLLKVFVSHVYLNTLKPVEDSTDKRQSAVHVFTPFRSLLAFHRRMTKMPNAFRELDTKNLPCTREVAKTCEIQKLMDERFNKIVSFMYNNYVKYKYTHSKEERSAEEILSIFNTPHIPYIVEMWEETVKNFRDSQYDPLFTEGSSLFRTRLSVYFVHLDEFYRSVDDYLALHDEQANKEKADSSPKTGFHFSDWRKPWVTERKDQAEYERLVQLSRERDKREAEQRLAAQREKDAKIAAQREEAAREAERANQERQDAILRRLEKVNFHEAETLDAVAVAKAAETEREAREAKEKAIAESRARRREQKEKQKVRDEAEAKEHEKREHARETAKRIAHGEGYSKRKGNKA